MIPKVSILIATYNRSHLIGEAIKSAQGQTFQDWEIIVVDDASTDNTEDMVKKWQISEPRIIYSKSEVNQGIAINSNRGLELAKGEYIAVLDDDDYWTDNNKLMKQIEFLNKNKEYAGCGGGVIVVNDGGKELFRYQKPETDEKIRNKILFSNPMANATTLFRKSTALGVNLYDETTRYAADRDFWLKMGTKGKLYNFPLYFTTYRMTGENTSITKIRPHLKASLRFMKRYKNDYPHYPSALAINYLQLLYSLLPNLVRKPIHSLASSLKRKLFG